QYQSRQVHQQQQSGVLSPQVRLALLKQNTLKGYEDDDSQPVAPSFVFSNRGVDDDAANTTAETEVTLVDYNSNNNESDASSENGDENKGSHKNTSWDSIQPQVTYATGEEMDKHLHVVQPDRDSNLHSSSKLQHQLGKDLDHSNSYTFSHDPWPTGSSNTRPNENQYKEDEEEGWKENHHHMRRAPFHLLQEGVNGRLEYPPHLLKRESSLNRSNRDSQKGYVIDGSNSMYTVEDVEGSVISISDVQNVEDHIEQTLTGEEIQFRIGFNGFNCSIHNHSNNDLVPENYYYQCSTHNLYPQIQFQQDKDNMMREQEEEEMIIPNNPSVEKIALNEEYSLYLAHIYELILTIIRVYNAQMKEHVHQKSTETATTKASMPLHLEDNRDGLLLYWFDEQCSNGFNFKKSLELISLCRLFDYSDYASQLPMWYSSFVVSVGELLLKLVKKSESIVTELIEKYHLIHMLCLDILQPYYYDIDIVSLVFSMLRQLLSNQEWAYMLLEPEFFDVVMDVSGPWWAKSTSPTTAAQSKPTSTKADDAVVHEANQQNIHARKEFHTQMDILKFFVDLSVTNPFDLLEHDVMNK
ncbi:hypothetical protein RFI_10224, partial [Reticulomyxa filosa]